VVPSIFGESTGQYPDGGLVLEVHQRVFKTLISPEVKYFKPALHSNSKMSQSSSPSKGIPRDVINKSRGERAKYREKQKSDANQKAKKALEAAEKERLKYDGLRDKLKELHKNYDDGKRSEFKEEYENATKDFKDSRTKLADLQIVLKQAQNDVDMPDADVEEEIEKSLFVPEGRPGQSSASPAAPPSVNVT
jgi:hypothetical protein